MNTKIILASTSVYRKEILEKLQLPFDCLSPNVDESPIKGETAQALVLRLAKAKAVAGAKLYNTINNNLDTHKKDVNNNPETKLDKISYIKSGSNEIQPAVIIGSDQVAVIDGKIVGKPHSSDKAIKQLQQASGKAITFYTGLSVIHSQTLQAFSLIEPFTVHFRELTLAEITRYVELEQPLYCAGSFKAEGLGIALFEKLEGDDPNTLIGLPLIKLIQLLKKHDIQVL
ncbi:nucleoside triphosphate pyrophosphatase [Shewanella sp. 1_MG-2023]|uniref:Maf family protein n=1 Tax=unclassified Shewanella TaxID=196818 RepID=UPI0026E251CB|nr:MULTISPECIES: nucleoside triphosphate pyrophosphatase [unclassified Shewanella]MDO6611865.1 nucleoside triphosphate pyrophosphatase [Shewanella sp. 7_MG-2023]MDO6771720.1 nucleoside triphosphate pyrophosphatase [Shewanella sp. 2_MG-2023]MDO6793946.1 nucleoside triphosphate pyrophosphatase [Shewanella sp. 1_MG-2023]